MASPQTQELGDKIRRYLNARSSASLRRLFAKHNFADVAEALENVLSEDEAVKAFQFLNIGQAAQVLTSLNEERQMACISSLPAVMGSKILRSMAADDAVDILQELDTKQSEKLLKEMPFDTDTRTIQHLLLEEPDTAAGLMSPDYIACHINQSVGEAMSAIKGAEEKDFIYYCYLIDDDGKLVGVVSLKTLILHDESVPLQRIALYDVKSIMTSFDQELVTNLFRKYYNLLAMPVVDTDDTLKGVITLDDIVDIIDEESSEEIYRASGIDIEEIDEKNLLMGPILTTVKARLPWLAITVVGQIMGSFIIAAQAPTVAAAVIAVSFMPLLTGLSGNMGTQSATIAVRGLSQNLLTSENVRSKLGRELNIALITGLTFGTFVGLFTYFVYHHWELSALLFGWIVVSLCFSALAGIAVPYLSDKVLKVDPATLGGPLITTASDILTFSLYLSLLKLLLDRLVTH